MREPAKKAKWQKNAIFELLGANRFPTDHQFPYIHLFFPPYQLFISYDNPKNFIQSDFAIIERYKPVFEKKREYLQEIQDKKREFNKEKTIYDRSWIIILSVVSGMLFIFFGILLAQSINKIKRT